MATKKTIKSASKAIKTAGKKELKLPSPRYKLNIKTKRSDNDWYEAAFKRFSISLNRTNPHRDPLAAVSPPIKANFQ